MPTMTRGQVQDLVSRLAVESRTYRDRLISDPKAVVEQQFHTSLGPVAVQAVVETADTRYVVVPYVAVPGQLTDADLERVAGGKNGNVTVSCTQTGAGVGNTYTQTNV